MDADRFDDAVRSLAASPSRRRVLGLTLGGGLSALLGLADVAAKKRKRKNKKQKKKRKCLFGQRRCRDRRCHGCCSNADCGGNECELGVCRDCPRNERPCRGGCIPESSCCTDDECDGQQTCVDGVCGCRANERLCDGACIPVEYCCTTDDCEGAPCVDGQCQCGEGQRECRGECIPETSCCRTSDCSACERCEDETCVDACPTGQSCQDGACRCPSGEAPCGDACIPEDGCCTSADCGPGDACLEHQCVIVQGTCPAGEDICAAVGFDCGPGDVTCVCFQSTTGETRCATAPVLGPGAVCDECVDDSDCEELYPDVPGAFCSSGGPNCGCRSDQGVCHGPCSA